MAKGVGESFFRELLQRMVDAGASDLHLKTGLPPIVRHKGSLRILSRSMPPVGAAQIVAVCMEIIPEHLKPQFSVGKEIDLAYGVTGVGRFRLNIFRHRSQVGIIARFIPFEIKSFDQLGLPEVLKSIAVQPWGLVLITGHAGAGKSTTLAAMLNEWNSTRGGHIITIEDPIEFLIRDRKSIITQREIGIDTENFESGLKYALRQDPDVIMIGELRDRETIQTGINAAETGHLVLATLHTKNASETLQRVLGVFPPDQQSQVRVQFAAVLAAIISQRLLPKHVPEETNQVGDLVPAVEVLINTGRIKDCLLDPQKFALVEEQIEQGAQYGMLTFDQSIMQLFEKNLISRETALQFASNPSDFELRLRGIRKSSESW